MAIETTIDRSTSVRDATMAAPAERRTAALGDQIQIAESVQAVDPQLVLVMEARDENLDLVGVADKLGIDIISQADTRVDFQDEF